MARYQGFGFTDIAWTSRIEAIKRGINERWPTWKSLRDQPLSQHEQNMMAKILCVLNPFTEKERLNALHTCR